MTYYEVILRAIIGFGILLILIRVLGKKQISQITFFTYITGIALGNIASDMIVHKGVEISHAVFGLTLWTILTLCVEQISLRSPKFRVLLDGEPTIVIKKGRIMKKAMSSQRLNLGDLTMLLREKDIFSVSEVEYAILEPNGQISVFKKTDVKPGEKNNQTYMPAEIIADGQIVKRNLKEIGKNEEWLAQQLKKEGIQFASEVLFAEIKQNGDIYFDRGKM